jgi:DNA-binding GntR family transcriptional regulator
MKADAATYDFLDRDTSPGRGNITGQVTDVLRQAIVSLELKPGEVLDKGLICGRLGVSRFPVSEALARLASEGLVDIQPQRGSTVSLVRIGDVLEHMLIRRALEAEAVRTLAADPEADLIEALEESLAAQRRAAEKDDQPDFHRRDVEFHDHLFAALELGRLKAVIDSSRANLDRARQLINSPRRLALTISEHEKITAAIASRNPDAAAAAMRAHLNAVMEEVVAFAAERPEVFADGGVALERRYIHLVGA